MTTTDATSRYPLVSCQQPVCAWLQHHWHGAGQLHSEAHHVDHGCPSAGGGVGAWVLDELGVPVHEEGIGAAGEVVEAFGVGVDAIEHDGVGGVGNDGAGGVVDVGDLEALDAFAKAEDIVGIAELVDEGPRLVEGEGIAAVKDGLKGVGELDGGIAGAGFLEPLGADHVAEVEVGDGIEETGHDRAALAGAIGAVGAAPAARTLQLGGVGAAGADEGAGLGEILRVNGGTVEHEDAVVGLAAIGAEAALEGGVGAVVLGGVDLENDAELAEVVGAGGSAGGLARAGEAGQQHAGEHADDPDDHQELNEGETAVSLSHRAVIRDSADFRTKAV